MIPSEAALYDERVLLLAPTRRDGEVTARALAAAGMQCQVCGGVEPLVREAERGVGALMATELLLTDAELPRLFELLQHQPPWSSVPMVLLCRDREQSPLLDGARSGLLSLTLVDRPASLRTMVSAVQASLRGRRWQYQIRDQLIAQAAAEEALRLADQRKDEFLATLAHELRNPLAPIKAGLQLLQMRGPADSGSSALMSMMERQLAQMVKLIDQLLDVSRIATGKVMLERERIDLRRVVETALEASQPAFDAAGHRVSVDLPGQPLCVMGDPLRLAQAVGNLLNNAAKYTPNGGRIAIEARRQGGEAVLVVSDSGMGIPPEMVDRVFDLFAQVDRTLDRAKGGLGIGLSLVRNLMELHGGSISARSAGIDQGSRFEMRLPAVDGAPAGADAAPPAPPAGAAGHRLRIMIVDDNRDAADALGLLLQLEGHDTRVEYGAREALDAAAVFLPEVVLCDLGMPGMGGHEFAARLRSDARFAGTLLVAITGWGGEAEQRRSREAGFDHHLTKPAGADAIAALLKRR